MPELPEVQTTVNGLNQTVKGLTIKEVWTDLAKKNIARTDYKHTIKYLPFFESFEQKVVGKKIIGAERRAKNILINLSGGHTILVHMKMTGHMMYGTYKKVKSEKLKVKTEYWEPVDKTGPLGDPFNKYLHFVITFTNGKQLVLSDVRKFAKVTLLATHDAHQSIHLDVIGPEPLEKAFTLEAFKKQLLKKPNGKIKSVLMDQTVVAGVGNIYSDEALWLSDIQPESKTANIPEAAIKKLYTAIGSVLKKGIDFGGDSTSDYRNILGERGKFSANHNAYRLTGKPCRKRGCPGTIRRIVVQGRSAHFCPVHQKLYS